jgi:hypothetical protein
MAVPGDSGENYSQKYCKVTVGVNAPEKLRLTESPALLVV